MGFDLSAWLSARLLGRGKGQKGVSSYIRDKKITTKGLDAADPYNESNRSDDQPYRNRQQETD